MAIFGSDNTRNNVARFKSSRKFYVFFISLFLAASFWLLNALNKTYVEKVNIVIKYINLPDNRAFAPFPPSSINIELSGDGYSLMQLIQKAEEDTVVVDISQLEFKSNGSRKSAQVPTSLIIDDLSNSMSNGVNVSRVNRDTITITTERGARLEFGIKPNFDLTLSPGFVLVRPVYCDPEVLLVQGPLSVLDTLKSLDTKYISIEDVSETSDIEVFVEYDKRVIKPELKLVKLVVEVESLTEGEISIPVSISGLPDGKRVRLIPNSVSVKYQTGLSHYDYIKPELFSATVSYADVLKNPSKLQVKIISFPSYVQNIQFTPERIEYLTLDLTD